MGLINLATIKPQVQDFATNGTSANFLDPNGDKITGHIFTRQELYDALGTSATSEYFMVSALSPYPGASIDFLNLVLCRVDGGVIDINALYVSSTTPMSGALTFNTNNATNPDGKTVTARDFTDMYNDYINDADPKPLILASDEKVKGYNFTRDMIEALGLQDQPTSENKNDTFAFIPMIRPVDSLTNKPYLTFALAYVNDGVVSGDIFDFVDPCPTACNNYQTVFI
ncbi:hypothetical protein [Lishizhenia sp.]|uniref:hypothetical protein n=1 Tax=Lishizhenia sp. TaxID=2497594 RepID=UPI00299E0570|nr:hypothetical protein [Lishizhenia sp.]MDX1445654.1 hypothetical protein [Lishizhenia sp.]